MRQMEPHYAPDMPAALDSDAEIMADEFGLKIEVATRICHNIRVAMEKERWEVAAPILSDAIGLMIQPCRNLNGRLLGLVFSFGLADVVNGNTEMGIQSMADEGRRHGVSRALMSHYKREWDNLFSRYGRVFGKSPEACEKNRAARMRVIKRGNKDASSANAPVSRRRTTPDDL